MRGFFVYNSMKVIGITLLIIIGLYLLIGLCFYLWWLYESYNDTIRTFKYKNMKDKWNGIWFTIKWGFPIILIWAFILFDNKKYK